MEDHSGPVPDTIDVVRRMSEGLGASDVPPPPPPPPADADEGGHGGDMEEQTFDSAEGGPEAYSVDEVQEYRETAMPGSDTPGHGPLQPGATSVPASISGVSVRVPSGGSQTVAALALSQTIPSRMLSSPQGMPLPGAPTSPSSGALPAAAAAARTTSAWTTVIDRELADVSRAESAGPWSSPRRRSATGTPGTPHHQRRTSAALRSRGGSSASDVNPLSVARATPEAAPIAPGRAEAFAAATAATRFEGAGPSWDAAAAVLSADEPRPRHAAALLRAAVVGEDPDWRFVLSDPSELACTGGLPQRPPCPTAALAYSIWRQAHPDDTPGIFWALWCADSPTVAERQPPLSPSGVPAGPRRQVGPLALALNEAAEIEHPLQPDTGAWAASGVGCVVAAPTVSGDWPPTGSWLHPFTVEDALLSLRPGISLQLAPGVYAPLEVSGLNGGEEWVCIRGAASEEPSVFTEFVRLDRTSRCVLAGLDITGKLEVDTSSHHLMLDAVSSESVFTLPPRFHNRVLLRQCNKQTGGRCQQPSQLRSEWGMVGFWVVAAVVASCWLILIGFTSRRSTAELREIGVACGVGIGIDLLLLAPADALCRAVLHRRARDRDRDDVES
eukprot:TRINITY_DN5139_c1_g2_i1.p1 TRINITY_DN5139_c1_g2~~TRINITY_DN5139_c1_g2_i1.p1  ORF type:complete len:638 (+),score=101.71 TRINITY_DN5139_c1_g2_i1:75-1916(+)